MAGGPTTSALVLAAATAGSLGFLAGGYLTADALAEQRHPGVRGDLAVRREPVRPLPGARRPGCVRGVPRADPARGGAVRRRPPRAPGRGRRPLAGQGRLPDRPPGPGRVVHLRDPRCRVPGRPAPGREPVGADRHLGRGGTAGGGCGRRRARRPGVVRWWSLRDADARPHPGRSAPGRTPPRGEGRRRPPAAGRRRRRHARRRGRPPRRGRRCRSRWHAPVARRRERSLDRPTGPGWPTMAGRPP